MELTQKIESDGKLIGYVYIRASLDELSRYVQNRVLFDILIALCSLIGAFIIANEITTAFYSAPLQSADSGTKSIKRKGLSNSCSCHGNHRVP